MVDKDLPLLNCLGYKTLVDIRRHCCKTKGLENVAIMKKFEKQEGGK
jgi:hypothetical protein